MQNFMTHFKQITIRRKQAPISSVATALYYTLCEYDNELGWMDYFTAPNGVLSGLAGLSLDTLKRARAELVEKGYIEYHNGAGNQAGKYLIVDFAPQTAPQSALQTAHKSHRSPHRNPHPLTKPNEDQYIPCESADADRLFNEFWEAYPKKRSKADALKAWRQANISETLHARIMAAVEVAKKSEGWKKDDGQFIPYPASWLRAGAWDDELSTPAPGQAKQEGKVLQRWD